MVRKRVVNGIGLVALALVLLFALIQLIPYEKNHTNPPVAEEPAWDSPQTRALAQRACFDCHSNETVWPWYSNVAPVSWLVQHDVDEGRHHLNFSDMAATEEHRESEGHSDDDVAEMIESGEMPPWYYILMHPEANLSEDEKQQLIEGLQASLPQH